MATISVTPRLEAQSGPWPAPYSTQSDVDGRPTVGGYLERAFGGILQQCGVQKLTAVVRKARRFKVDKEVEEERSAIPRPLQVIPGVSMTTPVGAQWSQSAASLFAYIYTPDEIAGIPRFDARRMLNTDLTLDPVLMLPQGRSTTVYNHSCSSIVNSALSVSGGFKLPPARLEAAVKAEYDASQADVLALVIGKFNSPFEMMLSSSDVVDQTFARLSLWDWYGKNAMQAAGAKYLSSFTGLALYAFQRTNRKADGSVSLGTGASSIVASLDAKLQSALSSQDEFRRKMFSTAVLFEPRSVGSQPELHVDWQDVPSAQALATDLARVSARPIPTFSRRVFAGQEHFHQQTLLGVPATLCSVSSWSTEKKGSAPTVIVQSADPGSEGTTKYPCVFTVAYMPSEADWAPVVPGGGARVVALEYDLVSSITVSGTAVRIPAGRVELSPSQSPTLVATIPTVPYKRDSIVAGGQKTYMLNWPLQFVVYDEDGARVDPGRLVTPQRIQIACASGPIRPVTPAATYAASRLDLPISYQVPVAGEDLDFDAPAQQCTLTGTLIFSLQAQVSSQGRTALPVRTVEQPLPAFTISFPRAKQSSPPPSDGDAGSLD